MFSFNKFFSKFKSPMINLETSQKGFPQFRMARDMSTMSNHIVNTDEEALCGTDSAMYGTHVVTIYEVLEMGSAQHSGSYLCSLCASKFTGEDKSYFVDAYLNSSLNS